MITHKVLSYYTIENFTFSIFIRHKPIYPIYPIHTNAYHS